MKSREIALCGMMNALAVVLLSLGGLVPIATYCAPLLAMAVLLPVQEEYGNKLAITAWVSVSLLALMLTPDRETALVYVFFGWYPVARPRIASLPSRLVRLAVRLIIANAAILLLYGAVLRAMLGAGVLARRRGGDVAATLDEIACPGLLAVAVCRLGEWTVGEGVGTWIENPMLMRLPFAVCNEYEEWQLAVFLWAALAALILMASMLRVQGGKGERVLSALLLYACCQVVLESLRMDSCLKMGFVRVSQVISALVILGVTAIRAYRNGGKQMMLRRCAPIVLVTALIGGIEWALDKTVISNIQLYTVMIAACAGLAVNGLRFEKRGLTD